MRESQCYCVSRGGNPLALCSEGTDPSALLSLRSPCIRKLRFHRICTIHFLIRSRTVSRNQHPRLRLVMKRILNYCPYARLGVGILITGPWTLRPLQELTLRLELSTKFVRSRSLGHFSDSFLGEHSHYRELIFLSPWPSYRASSK